MYQSTIIQKNIHSVFFIEAGEQSGGICEGSEWEPCDTGQLSSYLIIDHLQNHVAQVDDYQ